MATAKMKFGQGLSLFGQEGPEFHTRDSFVMAKRGGAWKIVHFHSTTIHPLVAKGVRPDFGVTR